MSVGKAKKIKSLPRKMKLRFLVAGLGSMGRRRIRNLQVHGERDITGFDILPRRNAEAEEKYGIRTIKKFSDVSPKDFDVMIISASPEAHGDYIRFALQHKKHFFIEHCVTDDGYTDIFSAGDSGVVRAPSCTMRFCTPIKMIKKILDGGAVGKVLAFQYHMGQYLPDWHPWEDYRGVYFSKKATGACREMLPFELIWLNWVMNSKVVDINGTAAKVSDLDMDAEDIILANVRYKNNVLGNIIIDAVSRKPFRTLRVMGSDGVLDWERFDSTIKVHNTKTNATKTIPVPKGHPEPGYVNEEEMYNDEIKAFLADIRGGAKFPHSFAENASNLKMLFKLIKS